MVLHLDVTPEMVEKTIKVINEFININCYQSLLL